MSTCWVAGRVTTSWGFVLRLWTDTKLKLPGEAHLGVKAQQSAISREKHNFMTRIDLPGAALGLLVLCWPFAGGMLASTPRDLSSNSDAGSGTDVQSEAPQLSGTGVRGPDRQLADNFARQNWQTENGLPQNTV